MARPPSAKRPVLTHEVLKLVDAFGIHTASLTFFLSSSALISGSPRAALQQRVLFVKFKPVPRLEHTWIILQDHNCRPLPVHATGASRNRFLPSLVHPEIVPFEDQSGILALARLPTKLRVAMSPLGLPSGVVLKALQ